MSAVNPIVWEGKGSKGRGNELASGANPNTEEKPGKSLE